MSGLLKLEEITKGQLWIGLGVAGNQAGHLAQAGEATDFKDVISEEEHAPKGIFPWFIPNSKTFLETNPISAEFLRMSEDDPIQPEPEIALIVKFHYSEHTEQLLESISVCGFTAFNDCSRRINAPKISLKKNWGVASQGMLDRIIPIDDFVMPGGKIERFRLCCYLVRDERLLQYGEDTAISEYCYLNEKLLNWMGHQINTQQQQGPLEEISELLVQEKPQYGVIGIGATCYTGFGNSEERFLLEGDQVIVAAYDGDEYDHSEVEEALKRNEPSNTSFLILKQEVTSDCGKGAL